jgi:thiosulfate dehydrogenase
MFALACLIILFILTVEGLRSGRFCKGSPQRFYFHFGLFIFNTALFSLLFGILKVPLLGSLNYAGVGVFADLKLDSISRTILSFLFLDLLGYWLHRFNHWSEHLWKLHELHHTDQVIDFTTGLRESPLHMVLNSFLLLFSASFLGVSLEDWLRFSFVGFLANLFHHAQPDLPPMISRILGMVLITPNVHLLHHRPLKGLADCNYGSIFSFWDRMFGTLSLNEARNMRRDIPSRFVLGMVFCFLISGCNPNKKLKVSEKFLEEAAYGREIIKNTARLLGPMGSVRKVAGNRMNCQNCHLNGGEKDFGISFRNTFTKYPEYQARQGKLVTLADRINNCFERPMNGKPLEVESREMRALLAYYRQLSMGKRIGEEVWGDSLNSFVVFSKRAADPKRGAILYSSQCANCHGANGEGKLTPDRIEFVYPPLWGNESYNEASNMHRNIKLATFIRANMPLGATAKNPILDPEQAFDLASFINDSSLHPRPKTRWNDYTNISEKPIDYPQGPFRDKFSEEQHRLGPYLPIIEFLNSENRAVYY